MPRHKNTRSNRNALWVVIVVVLGFLVISRNTTSPAKDFVTQHKVPYTVLIPSHLPTKSIFKADLSSYDEKTQKTCLVWVYPAQTMPGQGTVIVCEQLKDDASALPEIKNSKYIEFDNTGKHYEGDIGVIARGNDVPDQPGQRLLLSTISDVRVSIVAYALSDDELLKIAASLQR